MTIKYTLFLPCAAGVEGFLQQEVEQIISEKAKVLSGGVVVAGTWHDVLKLNLCSRLAQRVLLRLSVKPYSSENDIYQAAAHINWSEWFGVKQTFKVEITARRSPLKSLNFAALKIKDAVADYFRQQCNIRPNVNRYAADVRIFAHLSETDVVLYLDTSGEPLFKRGWRQDKGDAPLKETLAAAMLVASGWNGTKALYDPCCGSGTIAIEAAQKLANIAPGQQRQFAFSKLKPFNLEQWQALKLQVKQQEKIVDGLIFASDVSHRMVDFAAKNALRAGVAQMIEFRGGDMLQRQAPTQQPGVMLLNPPYGERLEMAGEAKKFQSVAKVHTLALHEQQQYENFLLKLSSHWKKNYSGWQAWVLSPDRQLPQKMRFKASKKTPLWNGPIECRLFCFEIVVGSHRREKAVGDGE